MLLFMPLSDAGLLTLGQDFVAGERVTLGVVGTNAIGLHQGLEGSTMMTPVVLHQVAHISLVEVTVETSLNILDFLGHDGIVVILGGLFNELLVKGRLEEGVEVAHETGIEAELVLGEDRLESMEALLANLILLLLLGEGENSLNDRAEGETVDQRHHTALKHKIVKSRVNLRLNRSWPYVS